MSNIEQLYRIAKQAEMTAVEKENQRESFVFGSTKIENDKITKDLVKEVANRLRVSGSAGD